MLPFCNNYPADVWVCTLWFTTTARRAETRRQKAGGTGPGGVVFGGDFYDINRYWYFLHPSQ
jgi:hypothetical protein